MIARRALFSSEEYCRRGNEIYDRDVRPCLRPDDDGKFAAIDIVTRGYEIHVDDYTATEHLLACLPEAQIWLVRVGHKAAYRIGRPFVAGVVE